MPWAQFLPVHLNFTLNSTMGAAKTVLTHWWSFSKENPRGQTILAGRNTAHFWSRSTVLGGQTKEGFANSTFLHSFPPSSCIVPLGHWITTGAKTSLNAPGTTIGSTSTSFMQSFPWGLLPFSQIVRAGSVVILLHVDWRTNSSFTVGPFFPPFVWTTGFLGGVQSNVSSMMQRPSICLKPLGQTCLQTGEVKKTRQRVKCSFYIPKFNLLRSFSYLLHTLIASRNGSTWAFMASRALNFLGTLKAKKSN